ncbi:hypothetical protein RI129_004230 [Pyrocoelia pectoralis]|uniref:Uncharacterized protein n=1 Tax=Pyrocoelia pectoralis TaxID=417401 RepID=A0AAN7VID5_9COLE
MFKSQKVRGKPFPLTVDQMKEDIAIISNNIEQRNKLFICIDDKIPVDNKYGKMDAFFKGTESLHEIPISLTREIKKLEEQSEVIKVNTDIIKRKIQK